jgi:hypothetical protein
LDRAEFEVLKRSLQNKNELPIRIISDSMFPLLKVNETLVVSRLPSRLEMFDLVVFFQSNRLNCHFLWRDQRDFDNSIVTRSLKEPKKDDPPVHYDLVLGMVKGKTVSVFQKIKILFYISVAGF